MACTDPGTWLRHLTPETLARIVSELERVPPTPEVAEMKRRARALSAARGRAPERTAGCRSPFT